MVEPPQSDGTSVARPPRAATTDWTALFRGLEEVYADLEKEIARHAPLCERSGVCCDFDRVPHVLYASSVEAAYVRAHVVVGSFPQQGNRCPFLTGGLCGARAHRALGCRVYYCDPRWKAHEGDVYERYYARVKQLWEAHAGDDLPWEYAPLLEQLARMREGAP